MDIKRFVTNPIGENCYIVSNKGEAVIIDCGCFDEQKWLKVKAYIEEEHLTLRYALQTHMHFDHVMGLPYLQRDFGLLPMCHAQDLPTYEGALQMAEELTGAHFSQVLPSVGGFLSDGQQLTFGGLTIEVLYTPGHTPGGLCFYIPSEKTLFSGDTLFQGSIGRTDFPGGSMQMEVDSVRERILTLPDDTTILPGHGPHTTVSYEKRYNMYIN